VVSAAPISIDSIDMLDLLGGLVERSLVGFDERTGRYTMLETVRQYSREKLADSEEGQPVRERHVGYVRAYVAALPRPDTLIDSLHMISVVDPDVDNLRGAIEHLLSLERWGEAGSILRQSQMYWIWSSKVEEVRSYYRRLLEPFLSEEREQDFDVAEALLAYCALYMFDVHNENALPDLEFALRTWTKLGVPEKISHCYRFMGNIHLAAGRVDQAEQNYLKAASFLPDGKPDGALLNNLGLLEIVRKNWAGARELLEESLKVTTSNRMKLASYANLSRVAFQQGRLDETREFILKLLEWHGETLSPFGVMPTLERVAEYVLAVGRPSEGAACLGAAQRLRDEHRFSRSTYEEEDFDRIRSGCLAALGDEEFWICYAAGGAMTLDEAFQLARGAMGA